MLQQQFFQPHLPIDMIKYFAEQAAAHAARNPSNPHAVNEAQRWHQRLLAAVQQSQFPQAAAAAAPGVQAGPVPSNLFGAPAPTPPSSMFEVPTSWGFNQNSKCPIGVLPPL